LAWFLQRSEQYLISSQFLAHLLRHWKGLLHTWQILMGRWALNPLLFTAFLALVQSLGLGRCHRKRASFLRERTPKQIPISGKP